MINPTTPGHWSWDEPKLTPIPLLTPPVDPVSFTIRVDLDGSKPPIWRRLSLPSNVTLDRLHDILQVAFGWTNSHLHRFTLTADRHGNIYEGLLTPHDLAEGDVGVPESTVRLDQLMAEPGDSIRYVYDFGDDWEHRLQLEAVHPMEEPAVDHPAAQSTDVPADVPQSAPASAPAARVLAGRRQGPPEDSGGIEGYEFLLSLAREGTNNPEYFDFAEHIKILRLAQVTDDLDIDGINRGLARLVHADEARGRLGNPANAHLPIVALIAGLGIEAQLHLAGFVAAAGLTEPVVVEEAEAIAATRIFRAYLQRLGDGVKLTDAGYLSPVVARNVMLDLDPRRVWRRPVSSEAAVWPLRDLREISTGLGLVRVFKGRLVPTKRATALLDSPVKLWHHIAERMPLERTEAGRDMALLVMLLVAAGETATWSGMQDSLDLWSSMLGWSFEGGGRYGNESAIYQAVSTCEVLEWTGSSVFLEQGESSARLSTDAARHFARAALGTLA